MRWKFFASAALQVTARIEPAQSFAFPAKTFTNKLIVIHGDVVQVIDLSHHLLFLHEILIDVVLKHLLRAKGNLHVMHWLEELRANIAFSHMCPYAGMLSKTIIWSSNNLQHFSNRWSENLRVNNRFAEH